MKRTLTTGLTTSSVIDCLDADGNFTSAGPWDYGWDADGARRWCAAMRRARSEGEGEEDGCPMGG